MEEMENLKNQLAAVRPPAASSWRDRLRRPVLFPPETWPWSKINSETRWRRTNRWMTYDQQREAYVRSVLAHTAERSNNWPTSSRLTQKVSHSKQQLLQGLQKDLEAQRQAASRAHLELQQHKDQTGAVPSGDLAVVQDQLRDRRRATLSSSCCRGCRRTWRPKRQAASRAHLELQQHKDPVRQRISCVSCGPIAAMSCGRSACPAERSGVSCRALAPCSLRA
ncbi:hypothetical protein CRUP_005293 [Coryphaenoides rupestris]|nr:hypothetical protein CRUP_005293 [Coryphaenoides rupestris]